MTGILWTAFGLVAGALYGLWADRGMSARRLKRIGRLLTPDTSMAVAWAEGPVDPQEMRQWTVGASDRVVLGLTVTGHGAALQAPASPPSS